MLYSIFSEGISQSKNHMEEFCDCDFWDFAGQRDFYATHQTFLTVNAIYLLVADLSSKAYSSTDYNNDDDIGGEIDTFFI